LTIEESIEIEKPIEAVYAIIRDLERAPEWQDSLVSVDVHAGTEVRSIGGRRHDATFVIQEDDPPRRLVITSESGPAAVRAEFDLQQAGDGTQLDFTLDIELRGVARFAGGMVRGAAQRSAHEDLERLKALAETHGSDFTQA
jgi:carbon monoxide dehydrogenase subunit G